MKFPGANRTISPRTLILVLLAAMITGCGGGSGGGGNNPATGSDWDSMFWDQGDWA